MGLGGTAYINDTIALHAVRCDDAACDAAGEEGAVSLHVYAPPIRRVKLYEQEENRWAGGLGSACKQRAGHAQLPGPGGVRETASPFADHSCWQAAALVLHGVLGPTTAALFHRPNRRVTVRAPGFATIRGVVDADLQDMSRLSSSL